MIAAPGLTNIWLAALALLGGLALLVAGGESLVAGAIRLATRQGMSSLLIGITVVAFGTSMPELFVSLSATLQGHVDIMVGNVIGSNIANIGLILAVAVLLAPLQIHFSRIRTELYLLLAASILLGAIAHHGTFSRWFGVLFVTGLLIYTVLSYRRAVQDRHGAAPHRRPAPTSWTETAFGIAALTGGGLLLMAYGSDWFIDGAVELARYFKVSELVIGLSVAAVGTSLPELASSLAAVRRREGDLVVGNILGSNLFNLLMVMGSTALITPFSLAPAALGRDLPAMLGFAGILLPVLYVKQGLSRLHGLLLLLAYAGYIFSLV